mgnify:FL=1
MPSTIGNYSRAKLKEIIEQTHHQNFHAEDSPDPAGADSAIQYNNGGDFGGADHFTYNDSTGEVKIADDKKLYFGTNSDGYIEYDEDGSDTMVFGLPAGGGQILDDKKLYFGTNKDVSLEYDEDGNDTLSIEGDVLIEDDHKLYFGTNKDAFIEYDEDVSDYLTISGSSNGIALSGSKIQIAGTLVGASPLKIAGGIEIVADAGEPTTAMTFGDDVRTYWGSDSDTFVQFRSTGTGHLVVSGSSSGIVMSGTVVEIDGKFGVGVSGDSVTHAITLPDTADAAGRVKANAYLTYSSIRYKEDIKTIKNPIKLLSDLRGITFSWKENKKSDYGFIAEEVGKKMPNIVEWDKDQKSAFSMDYTRIIPILVEGIKEQQLQIDKLKSEIKSLKHTTET